MNLGERLFSTDPRRTLTQHSQTDGARRVSKVLPAIPAALMAVALAMPAAGAQAKGTTQRLIVTAEAVKGGGSPPAIAKPDVLVFLNGKRAPVTDWQPLSANHAPLQLYLVLDDSTGSNIATQFSVLKKFIQDLPSEAAIGLAYMRNGTVDIVQTPTSDHAAAAAKLRLPAEPMSVAGSPYESVSALIKQWPASNARREMLVISNGVDENWLQGGPDAYTARAVHDAQRAGIVISTIYWVGVGHLSHTFWFTSWGEEYLSELSAQTGGESFSFGPGMNPVTIDNYLASLKRHLANQYMLTFEVPAGTPSGWQRVLVRTEVPNVDLVAATSVYVGRAKQR
jgi:hypothetical protein